jgi:hypothetical protein
LIVCTSRFASGVVGCRKGVIAALTLLRLVVFGDSGLLISGVFFLVRLQGFYFVSIVRIIAILVVLALP